MGNKNELQLMNTLMKTDIEVATHVALHGGTQKDAMNLRRRSEPTNRKKSSISYLSARSDTDTAAATDVRISISLKQRYLIKKKTVHVVYEYLSVFYCLLYLFLKL